MSVLRIPPFSLAYDILIEAKISAINSVGQG